MGRAGARLDLNEKGTSRRIVRTGYPPDADARNAGAYCRTYGASKAGVHAYTESLRAQLVGTGVEVSELVPPAVATAGQEKVNPSALPLGVYLDEVIALLTQDPTPHEVVVRAAQRLRWAERDGTYADLLASRLGALHTLPGR